MAYQQHIDWVRVSVPDGGKWMVELIRVIPSYTLQNVFCRRPTSESPCVDVQESTAWHLSGSPMSLLARFSIESRAASCYLAEPSQRWQQYSIRDRTCAWYSWSNCIRVKYRLNLERIPSFFAVICALNSTYCPKFTLDSCSTRRAAGCRSPAQVHLGRSKPGWFS